MDTNAKTVTVLALQKVNAFPTVDSSRHFYPKIREFCHLQIVPHLQQNKI